MKQLIGMIVAGFIAVLPSEGRADEASDFFVTANILAIFYHELGHAVIDVMDVPIFGQEEDAADVMAVLLIDWLFEEDAAQDIAYESAFGHINDPDQTEGIAWWSLHGPDEQRFYNHVCIFFGGNPDARQDFADDLGLPSDRAESCPDEYNMASNSWGAIFDEMDGQSNQEPLTFTPGISQDAIIANRVLAQEVANLQDQIKLPVEVLVRVESCQEANAFYDPYDQSITFCAEFIPHLRSLYDAAGAQP